MFGCPTRIHSDQGTEFKNKLWTGLMDRLQIEKTETPAYNPQSNIVERFHRSLNQIFRLYMSREDKSWERFLPMACFAYNTKINATTGISPFEAYLGRKAKMPIDLVVPLPDRVYQTEDEFIRETQMRFNTMFQFMRKNSETTFARNAKLYTGSINNYAVGDLVWLFCKRKVEGKPQKITDGWTGPYRITRIPADVLLDITPAETAGRTFTTHITRVLPFSGRTNQKYRPPKEPLGNDTDELAEEIGNPDQWVEPLDNLTIPIQIYQDPPSIRDLAMPAPIARPLVPMPTAPAAEPEDRPPAPTEPQPGPSGGARPKTQAAPARQGGQKRERYDSQTNPQPAPDKKVKKKGEKRAAQELAQQPTKQGRVQGTKRDREDEPPEGARTRSKGLWRDYAETESDGAMNSAASDDGAVHSLAPQPDVTVQVPPGASLPEKGTAGAAGWDCRANQTLTIEPGRCAKVDIGLRVAIPTGWCMLLHSRSKLATEGITVEAGLIDSDYRGPIQCVLYNHTHTQRRIQKGERICQALILPVPQVAWQTVAVLDDSARGAAGFGSTGSH